jgi:alpha-glucosidase
MPDEKALGSVEFLKSLGGQALVDAIKTSDEHLLHHLPSDETRRRTIWQPLGAVQSFVPYERGVRFACERGQVEMQWLTDDCLRVRLKISAGDFETPFSYAVHKTDWQPITLDIQDRVESIEIRSGALLVYVNKTAFALIIETLDGQPICRDTIGIQHQANGAVALSMALHPAESSYGMGERASSLNLRGKRLIHWNTDNADYERDSDPLYYCIPFYLGVHNGIVYGVFWDNSHRGFTDIGATKRDELRFESESGELRYYLFAGTEIKTILARYTELTGRIPLPPLWALGYQQCRFSYVPQSQVLEIANAFRQRQIPCDVLYLDIHYMDGFRIFTWDKQQFPEFEKMIEELHHLGFKVIAILDPGVKIDTQYEVYVSGMQQGVFLKYPNGDLAEGTVWPGLCHFPDFTSAAARVWWREQCIHLLHMGIDGLWNDMCEPVVFTAKGTRTLLDHTMHDKEGLGGNHLENHNVYGMLMGRASAEALAEQRPNKRPVNIIRAGFAGAQRHAISWTGDNKSDWDHLRLSIPMALNMGLSGAPFTGPDVGGFREDCDPELFTRWLQAACLMPFFRSHSAFNTRQQEPWAFGELYETINRATIQLRYQLLPYLYSVIAQAHEYGWNIIRPLFMAEPENATLRGVDDCYLVGDALLVAPVLERGAVQRHVYLPKGVWYDFWTHEVHMGAQTISIEAPLERLPLFVRAGTVLPLWDAVRYIGEKPPQTLTLRVYPGRAETVLYEDAGEGLDYQKGNYRWVYLSCETEATKISINRRIAGRYKPSYESIKVEVMINDAEPGEVRVDRRPAAIWFFDDGLLDFTIDDFASIEITLIRQQHDPTVARRF